MSAPFGIPYEVSATLAWVFVHMLWIGMLVGGVTAVGRLALRGSTASRRYGFSLACLGVLALGLVGSVIWVLGQDLSSPTPLAQVHQGVEGFPSAESTGATSPGTPSTVERWVADATPVLAWIWMLGTPLTLMVLALGLFGAHRLRKTSEPLTGAPARMARRLARELGVAQRVVVAVSSRIATPILVGVIKPMILLPPAALTGLSQAQLEFVLMHELVHARRFDNLVAILQRLLEALLFFHPVVWWLSRWARVEREASCDATVLARTGRPKAYAETLLTLASPPSLLPGVAMARHPLVDRIDRILNPGVCAVRPSRTLFTLLFAFGTGSALLVGPSWGSATSNPHDPQRRGRHSHDLWSVHGEAAGCLNCHMPAARPSPHRRRAQRPKVAPTDPRDNDFRAHVFGDPSQCSNCHAAQTPKATPHRSAPVELTAPRRAKPQTLSPDGVSDEEIDRLLRAIEALKKSRDRDAYRDALKRAQKLDPEQALGNVEEWVEYESFDPNFVQDQEWTGRGELEPDVYEEWVEYESFDQNQEWTGPGELAPDVDQEWIYEDFDGFKPNAEFQKKWLDAWTESQEWPDIFIPDAQIPEAREHVKWLDAWLEGREWSQGQAPDGHFEWPAGVEIPEEYFEFEEPDEYFEFEIPEDGFEFEMPMDSPFEVLEPEVFAEIEPAVEPAPIESFSGILFSPFDDVEPIEEAAPEPRSFPEQGTMRIGREIVEWAGPRQGRGSRAGGGQRPSTRRALPPGAGAQGIKDTIGTGGGAGGAAPRAQGGGRAPGGRTPMTAPSASSPFDAYNDTIGIGGGSGGAAPRAQRGQRGRGSAGGFAPKASPPITSAFDAYNNALGTGSGAGGATPIEDNCETPRASSGVGGVSQGGGSASGSFGTAPSSPSAPSPFGGRAQGSGSASGSFGTAPSSPSAPSAFGGRAQGGGSASGSFGTAPSSPSAPSAFGGRAQGSGSASGSFGTAPSSPSAPSPFGGRAQGSGSASGSFGTAPSSPSAPSAFGGRAQGSGSASGSFGTAPSSPSASAGRAQGGGSTSGSFGTAPASPSAFGGRAQGSGSAPGSFGSAPTSPGGGFPSRPSGSGGALPSAPPVCPPGEKQLGLPGGTTPAGGCAPPTKSADLTKGAVNPRNSASSESRVF